jgi:hypothetical protein
MAVTHPWPRLLTIGLKFPIQWEWKKRTRSRHPARPQNDQRHQALGSMFLSRSPTRASSPWWAWAPASACRPGDRLSWNLDSTSAGDLELGHHEGLPRQGAHADTKREVHVRPPHVRKPPWVKLPCIGTPQLRVQVHCWDRHVDVNARSHALASHAAEGDVAERLPRHLCAWSRSRPKLFASLQRLNGPPPMGGGEYKMLSVHLQLWSLRWVAQCRRSSRITTPSRWASLCGPREEGGWAVGNSLWPSSLALVRKED